MAIFCIAFLITILGLKTLLQDSEIISVTPNPAVGCARRLSTINAAVSRAIYCMQCAAIFVTESLHLLHTNCSALHNLFFLSVVIFLLFM